MHECPALSMRSLYCSQSWIRSVKSAPASSHGGRPAAKSSSMTHCLNGSETTGQLSTMPAVSRSQSRSAGAVAGVMRSTIEFGNVQCPSTHAGSAGSSRAAAESVAARVASPFRGTLSQLRIVIGPAPGRAGARARRRCGRTSCARGRAVGRRGSAYPDSVTVSDRISVPGAAISSEAAPSWPAGRVHESGDRPDDLSRGLAAVLLDQRVQAVLAAERGGHLRVAGEQSQADDPPARPRATPARGRTPRGGRGESRPPPHARSRAAGARGRRWAPESRCARSRRDGPDRGGWR